ncbi:SDR family oxidoreductase [Streptomyces sp. NPDC051940]|uniref:SDR family NAD(P)-dependent oxidoreductase n=1 Tax=Streptomyces sp. NPDC051940 TaxID=3155675 RepID=UPI0034157544
MTKLLQDKTAIVYGAAGNVGSHIARAFAREGARVFLAGRTPAKVEALAKEIEAEGGRAHAARVDALDKEQIAAHAAEVVDAAGRIDISANAIQYMTVMQTTGLTELALDDFLAPVRTAAATHFLTATEAARHMTAQGGGTILTLSTTAARLSGRDQGRHTTGGFSVACGAVETLTRQLAAELGPQGVRVVCLRPDALPETWPGEPPAGIRAYMEEGTALRRMPTLAQVGDTAAFVASDRAGAMTGTVVNLSCGSAVD